MGNNLCGCSCGSDRNDLHNSDNRPLKSKEGIVVKEKSKSSKDSKKKSKRDSKSSKRDSKKVTNKDSTRKSKREPKKTVGFSPEVNGSSRYNSIHSRSSRRHSVIDSLTRSESGVEKLERRFSISGTSVDLKALDEHKKKEDTLSKSALLKAKRQLMAFQGRRCLAISFFIRRLDTGSRLSEEDNISIEVFALGQEKKGNCKIEGAKLYRFDYLFLFNPEQTKPPKPGYKVIMSFSDSRTDSAKGTFRHVKDHWPSSDEQEMKMWSPRARDVLKSDKLVTHIYAEIVSRGADSFPKWLGYSHLVVIRLLKTSHLANPNDMEEAPAENCCKTMKRLAGLNVGENPFPFSATVKYGNKVFKSALCQKEGWETGQRCAFWAIDTQQGVTIDRDEDDEAEPVYTGIPKGLTFKTVEVTLTAKMPEEEDDEGDEDDIADGKKVVKNKDKNWEIGRQTLDFREDWDEFRKDTMFFRSHEKKKTIKLKRTLNNEKDVMKEVDTGEIVVGLQIISKVVMERQFLDFLLKRYQDYADIRKRVFTRDEVAFLLGCLGPPIPKDRLNHMLNYLDKDHNEKINRDIFFKFLHSSQCHGLFGMSYVHKCLLHGTMERSARRALYGGFLKKHLYGKIRIRTLAKPQEEFIENMPTYLHAALNVAVASIIRKDRKKDSDGRELLLVRLSKKNQKKIKWSCWNRRNN